MQIQRQTNQVFNQNETNQAQTYGQYYRQKYLQLTNLFSFNCQICEHSFNITERINFTKCNHNNFCYSCIKIYFKFKLLSYEDIKCPKDGCNSQVDTTCEFFIELPKDMQIKYNKIRKSIDKMKDANFRICPNNNCQGNIIFKGQHFQCVICSQQFCINCLQKKHGKQLCYLKDLSYLYNNLGLRRCNRCKFLIEKSQGCNYMKCRCGYQFCYKCNQPYYITHSCNGKRAALPTFQNEIIIDDKADAKNEKSLQDKSQKLISFLAIPVLIVLFIFCFGFYLLKMSIRTIFFFLKIILISSLLVILGVGPFTYEYLTKTTKLWRYIRIILLPISMTIGLWKSFKQLALFTMNPTLKRFKQDSFKLAYQLFIEVLE